MSLIFLRKVGSNLNFNMTRILLCFLLFFSLVSYGQNKTLLWNVDDLPQSLMQNPGAQIDFTSHFGIPFFSQIHFGVGSTGVSLHDVFDDSNPNVNQRIRGLMTRLTARDYVSVNEQLEILNFGWKVGQRAYVSAGVYQELDLFAYFPKDPALLAFEGNADYIGSNFNFSDVNFTGEMLTVYHAGLNFQVDPKLTVGARFKLYSGIFNAESTDNQGVFRTDFVPGGPNFYRHSAIGVNVVVNTSGYASLRDEEDMTVDRAVSELLSRSFFGQNVGVGGDIGFNYKVTEQLSISGSIQDIGLMFHQKDVENSSYTGSHTTYGLQPLFPELDAGEPTIPYWEIFEEQLDADLTDVTTLNSYTTWRPIKVNAGFQFGTGTAFLPCNIYVHKQPRFMNLFGMLLSSVGRPKGPTFGVMGYWDRKVSDTFRFRVSYTADDYSVTKFGAMVSKRFNNFNAYLAVDDIIGYTNLAKANSASLQLGLQFVFKQQEEK